MKGVMINDTTALSYLKACLAEFHSDSLALLLDFSGGVILLDYDGEQGGEHVSTNVN